MNSLTIKSYKVLKGVMAVAYHPKMIALACWVMVRYSKVVITCGYRDGDPGPAGMIPCRHLDIRSWIYENPSIIVEDINAHWIYDPTRSLMKCAIWHDTGKGIHIHLQVHDKTKYIKGLLPISDG